MARGAWTLAILALLWTSVDCADTQIPPDQQVDYSTGLGKLWTILERAVQSSTGELAIQLNARLNSLDARLNALSDLVTDRLDELKSQTASQESRQIAAETRLDMLDLRLEEALRQLTAHGSRLDSRDALQRETNSQLEDLEKKVDSQESAVDGLATAVSNITAELANLTSKGDSADIQLSLLSSKEKAQDDQLASLISKGEHCEVQLASLASNAESRDVRLNSLASKISHQESAVARLARTVDNRTASVVTLTSSDREHDTRLTSLSSEVTSQEARLDELATRVSGQESAVAELTTTVGNQSSRLAAVESREETSLSALDLVDCSDLSTEAESGTYLLSLGGRRVVPAFCSKDSDGGRHWTVIQRRGDMQPRQDFYLGWDEYKTGFGNLTREFWWGLQNLWLLTSSSGRHYVLRVDLGNWDGETRYAIYSTFRVASESDFYRLTVANYTGTAGDSLSYHNGQRFSAKDKDNDAWSGNHCAQESKGGWWYYSCFQSNLNGPIQPQAYSCGHKCMRWKTWSNKSLKIAEMKIRPV